MPARLDSRSSLPPSVVAQELQVDYDESAEKHTRSLRRLLRLLGTETFVPPSSHSFDTYSLAGLVDHAESSSCSDYDSESFSSSPLQLDGQTVSEESAPIATQSQMIPAQVNHSYEKAVESHIPVLERLQALVLSQSEHTDTPTSV